MNNLPKHGILNGFRSISQRTFQTRRFRQDTLNIMTTRTSKIAPWALVPILVSVSGCALPPALTIASLVTNAASYAATGKSISDHGISALAGEDCALWRVAANREICTAHPRALASSASPPGEVQEPKSSAVVKSGIDGELVDSTQKVAAAPELVQQTGRYWVLGSFINRANAQNLVASLGGIEAEIVTVDLNGATFHRVIVGPLGDRDVAALGDRVAHEARVQPWEISEPSRKQNVAALTARAARTHLSSAAKESAPDELSQITAASTVSQEQ